MTEADYHRYIQAFNARDYDTLESFFADDFALENAGFRVQGKPAFRAFYAFFHEYCREEVIFKGFFPGEGGFVSNVVIRFTGIKALSQEVLDDKGYSGMTPVPVGVSVDVEFYIHYILNVDGLIQYIKGAVWIPEAR
ncbi:MAG: nuclear transport factor 2 family protein [Candidatus Andeanibacterium colombiense]|uniref:Nuclear transport factor 2 family protein n=1 Tax=Candidatus Andeanibacterium colombiense TaxID=3121345 RepID=A0AAJ6BPF7_9SPHN|nr:MAG: nuclear transport factor 2 family protein [Sphingomonadaceae bacterium]